MKIKLFFSVLSFTFLLGFVACVKSDFEEHSVPAIAFCIGDSLSSIDSFLQPCCDTVVSDSVPAFFALTPYHCGCLPIPSISHENGFPVVRFPLAGTYRHSNINLSYMLDGSTTDMGRIDPATTHQFVILPASMGNHSYELSVTLTCNEKDDRCKGPDGSRCSRTVAFSYDGSSGGGTIVSPGDCGRNYAGVSVRVPESGQAVLTVVRPSDTGNTDMIPDQYEIFSQDRYGHRTSYSKGSLSVGENTIRYPNSASSSYLYLVKMYSSACGDHEKHFLEASLSVSPNTWPAVETNNH